MTEMFNFRSVHGTRPGKRYELEDFRSRYGLELEKALDLYERFGPSMMELDLLMAAKRLKADGAPVT